MMSLYDVVLWIYYLAHRRLPPNPARYVLGQPDWLRPTARVLDYGGGQGRWAVELAERAGIVVVADIDGRALARVPAHARVKPVLVDGVTLPFRSEAFDLVFVNHVLHHVQDLRSVLNELLRVGRKVGHLVVIEFDPSAFVTRVYRVLSRHRKHRCTFYTPRTLTQLASTEVLTVETERLDAFQFALVATRAHGEAKHAFSNRAVGERRPDVR